MTQKILVITYNMVPYVKTWGAAQRIYFLAEYLVKSDIDVTVLHSKKKNYGNFNKATHFHQVALPLKWKFLQQLLFGNIEEDSAKKISVQDKKNKQNVVVNIIKLFLGHFDQLIFNDPSPGMGIVGTIWVHSIKDFINKHLKDGTFKKVIISGPPFALFSCTKYIKKNFPVVKVIIDYRDPWNLWNNRKGFSFFKETEALNYADVVVVTNENLKYAIASKFGISLNKFNVVFNGFSEESWKKTPPLKKRRDNQKIKIAYIGSINFNSFRDPTLFFKAFESFPHKDDVLLSFIGLQNVAELVSLKNKFKDRIVLKGRVSQEESFSEMLDNDILLIFHTANDDSGKYLISAKLYDYIKSGKVVWSIGNRDSLNNQLVKEQKIGISSENTVEEILKGFEMIYESWKNNNLSDINSLSIQTDFFSRETQNERYLKIIKQEI
ncbi:hypothetical protein DSCO28_08260 [Desulfosarcina ovata subsp. sediminis]|uniref:Glycosyltransferase subfamily 4-like N-terminal domain-containing protein n=1 Tax=Desulfosarcina ovata subsp. sediminis TaxID=885957 RepID=A0A5K7ZNN8_9BACT|nr:hypothetical protein [Desulfosarcina ovata]BBO80260.1 hypothetical protein DSCO28_08260 [Desulfosarcina ovata subsp. sediminis]